MPPTENVTACLPSAVAECPSNKILLTQFLLTHVLMYVLLTHVLLTHALLTHVKLLRFADTCFAAWVQTGKCRKPQPFWPVPLTEHLNTSMLVVDGAAAGAGPGAGPASGGSVRKPPARQASTKTTPSAASKSTGGGAGEGAWLHDTMSKEDANELITNAGLDDGRFFVRRRGSDFPDDYVMCVVYRGRPTHHLIQQDGGVLNINKKPLGNCTTLADLVDHLRSPRPGAWPVGLTDHVPNGKPSAAASAPKSTRQESEPEPEAESEPEPEPVAAAASEEDETDEAKPAVTAASKEKKTEKKTAASKVSCLDRHISCQR